MVRIGLGSEDGDDDLSDSEGDAPLLVVPQPKRPAAQALTAGYESSGSDLSEGTVGKQLSGTLGFTHGGAVFAHCERGGKKKATRPLRPGLRVRTRTVRLATVPGRSALLS